MWVSSEGYVRGTEHPSLPPVPLYKGNFRDYVKDEARIFEYNSKILTFLRPDGSKRQAEREKTQIKFGFLLT